MVVSQNCISVARSASLKEWYSRTLFLLGIKLSSKSDRWRNEQAAQNYREGPPTIRPIDTPAHSVAGDNPAGPSGPPQLPAQPTCESLGQEVFARLTATAQARRELADALVEQENALDLDPLTGYWHVGAGERWEEKAKSGGWDTG
ncbi:uncharacterized protein EAF02_000887 [Botrytis sinoallii]|uniref:uncharacterized protein n=1 Tax=Botrytis sinoallii TaxID=1463999 RepID=UPI001900393B|nr:uncharacterized protein EAF02_000887 [Botrytis sinoallii]KAF7893349.1 hypothetical protein EAF02_000887 [Botrytis sinoallii]